MSASSESSSRPPSPGSFDSPPPEQVLKSGAIAGLVYDDVMIDDPKIVSFRTRKSPKEILQGNIVIGEQHEFSSPKLLTSYLIEEGFHELFFMEQVSQDYVADISRLMEHGVFTESLRDLLRKHDEGHGVKGFGYLDMFSKFAGKADRLKLTLIDRAGFRYKGGDSGIKRIVGMNQDCERMIREIAKNPEHPDHAALMAGKCVFFVGDSHAMRHVKTDFASYNEPGIADRINAVLQENDFPESSFFSNLSIKTLEEHAPDKDALVCCDTSKVNSVCNMSFMAQYVLLANEETIAKISSGNIDEIPVISFEDASAMISSHYGKISKEFVAATGGSKQPNLFGRGDLLMGGEEEESRFKHHIAPIDPHAEERHGVAAASLEPFRFEDAYRHEEGLLAEGLPLRSPSPSEDRIGGVAGVVAGVVANAIKHLNNSPPKQMPQKRVKIDSITGSDKLKEEARDIVHEK